MRGPDLLATLPDQCLPFRDYSPSGISILAAPPLAPGPGCGGGGEWRNPPAMQRSYALTSRGMCADIHGGQEQDALSKGRIQMSETNLQISHIRLAHGRSIQKCQWETFGPRPSSRWIRVGDRRDAQEHLTVRRLDSSTRRTDDRAADALPLVRPDDVAPAGGRTGGDRGPVRDPSHRGAFVLPVP